MAADPHPAQPARPARERADMLVPGVVERRAIAERNSVAAGKRAGAALTRPPVARGHVEEHLLQPRGAELRCEDRCGILVREKTLDALEAVAEAAPKRSRKGNSV